MWRRFCGMFGADAVERKYGRTIPDEWHAVVCRLNDYQLQQGMRRLVNSGKASVPSLPEFVKLARTVGHDDSIADEAPRNLAALTYEDQGDKWLAEANFHLRSYLNTKLAENSQRYGRPASYEAMKDPARKNDKTLDASPEFVRNVGVLVNFKNLWAEQMKLSEDPKGEVPVQEQQDVWVECMRRAEAEIANAA